jgi:hypothetical protein
MDESQNEHAGPGEQANSNSGAPPAGAGSACGAANLKSSDERQAKQAGSGEANRNSKDAPAHPAWEFGWHVFPWTLVLLGLLMFHSEIKSILKNLEDRIRLGAPVKIKDLELGAIKIDQGVHTSSVEGSYADDGSREKERQNYYDEHRRVMLVHTISRSPDRNGWYDIRIFLVPHNRIEDRNPKLWATLDQVIRVEYYFGGAWQNSEKKALVFPAQDRPNNFAVKVNAYGPFLATARVVFNDGKCVMLHRYIDFEMGDYAPVSALPEERKVQ